MKKLILPFILVAAFFSEVSAQQMSLYSLYMYNDYVLNPAVAGTKAYTPIGLSVRRQWSGFEGAPLSQSLFAHGYVGNNLGLGGMIVNEVTGPTRRSGLNFSAAYHLPLGKTKFGDDRYLSFGLSGAVTQHRFDVNKMTTFEPNDIAVINSNLNYQIIPDANFGLYFKEGDKFYAGLSVFNLIQTDVDLYEVTSNFPNGFKRQYYLMGGATFELSDNWTLDPSILGQVIESTPYQIEGSVLMTYDKAFSFGLSYRLDDAVVAMIGMTKSMFRFGYSYDYTLSDIRDYNTGSHEIFLQLQLPNGKTSRKR